jgi:hypothetical protein
MGHNFGTLVICGLGVVAGGHGIVLFCLDRLCVDFYEFFKMVVVFNAFSKNFTFLLD